MNKKKKQHKFKSAKDLLLNSGLLEKKATSAKYITREFQDFGYRLAAKLGDLEHKALYIRMAKYEKRPILEQALSYALDYPKAKNKAKIFMWKLKDLKVAAKQKDNQEKESNKNLPLI